MCLLSMKNKPIKCRVNLKCYKVFKVRYGFLDRKKDEFYSPFNGKKVPKINDVINGVVFEAECNNAAMSIPVYAHGDLYEVDEGYIHTFANIEDAKASIISKYFPHLHIGDCEAYEVWECVIPKGTDYYRGICPVSFNQYQGFASKKIKIVKQIILDW